MKKPMQARRLALLGILLQLLHVLFGVTAIMGVLIAHTKLNTVKGTIYHSQIRWQIVTFWTSLLAYSLALWLWFVHHHKGLLAVAALYVVYRLGVSIIYWQQAREIQRWL
ncbi:MAG: hypothetical protein KTR32_23560 [Granulosicoccus sp.]|nr:hypothetical protein [Granulosicoccus sp.]